MVLLADVNRLRELLPNVDENTIFMSLLNNRNQAFKTLHDFMLKDIYVGTDDQESTYKADYKCIRHFLPNISEARIKNVLDTIGTVPNRAYIAMKIIVFLLDDEENVIPKVPNLAPGLDQGGSVTRIVNGINLSETVMESDEEFNEDVPPLKLTLKRTKIPHIPSNNDWTVDALIHKEHSPIKKPKLENSTLAHDGTDSRFLNITSFVEDITNDVPEDLIDQPLPETTSVVSPPSSSVAELWGNLEDDIQLQRKAIENMFQEFEDIYADIMPGPVLPDPPPKPMKPSAIPVVSTSTRPILAPPKLFGLESFHQSDRPKNIQRKTSPVPSTSTHIPSPSVASTSSQIPEFTKTHVRQEDEQLVNKAREMFPEALPEYISQVCAGRIFDPQTFDEVVEIILNSDYPMRPKKEPSPERELDPKEQLVVLQSLLPDADPNYLKLQIQQIGMDHERFGMFVDQAIVKKDYPTKKDSEIKQHLSMQQSQYTTDFNVDRFLEIFPDPQSVFEDADRKATANLGSTVDRAYILFVIRMIFPDLYANDLHKQLGKVNLTQCNMYSLVKNIEAFRTTAMRKIIKKVTVDSRYRPLCPNIPLLQECAYFEHKTEILSRLETKRQQLAQERANAKELGLLETCGCCYDDEVMPSDILTCPSGCRFCRECIRKSTEVAFGDGKIDIICFTMDCNKEFSLQVLQNVLSPKMFSKLAQKKALAEVKAAGIEDLETCPFCDFANIPAPGDKIFRCLNPDCMKESCRECKEPSHLPLRCDEVEKDEDVKNRVYIENKMTEALIRQCHRCSAKFIKDEGCNKMTCSCGAVMCYICRQPVYDGYKHFNGQGGDRLDLCPLYTDNFSVNEKNVLEAAKAAKTEIDPKKLKHDPTADLEKHFKHQIKEHNKKKARAQANIPAVNNIMLPGRHEFNFALPVHEPNRPQVVHHHRGPDRHEVAHQPRDLNHPHGAQQHRDPNHRHEAHHRHEPNHDRADHRLHFGQVQNMLQIRVTLNNERRNPE